jgi:glucosamine 6-phosphate synthetase-like amidotransferase/phosphosugar isomerase protein
LSTVTEVEWEAAATELAGYPDSMTKEMHEQPAVLHRIAAEWHEHAGRLAAMIADAGDVVCRGKGEVHIICLSKSIGRSAAST